MKHDSNWLHTEITSWLSDGLINEQQATTLHTRYPIVKTTNWAQSILTAIGAIIFGLGVILFFAYNWSEMSKLVKLALVFTALAMTHGAGLLLTTSKSKQQTLIEGLHVLGTMMFGAGIFLTAQIYHIDEHYPTAFLVWGLAALALGWILPSTIQGLLAVILLTTWGLAEIFSFDLVHWPSALLVAAGLVSLAWVQRSRVLLALSLPASFVLLMANLEQIEPSVILPLVFCCSVLLIALAESTSHTGFPGSQSLLTGFGALAYGLQLFLLTTAETRFLLNYAVDSHVALLLVRAALILAALGCLVMLRRQWLVNGNRYQALHLLLILITVGVMAALFLGIYPYSQLVLMLVSSALFVLHGVILIVEGTDTVRWRLVVPGCLMLSVIIFLRFTDMFDSLLMRALAFVLLGGGLFLIGHFYSRSKHRQEMAHA